MPTLAFTARFYAQWLGLPGPARRAFRSARLRLTAQLSEQGFHPPFPAGLRIHKLHGTEAWSLSFGDGYRAVFRIGAEQRQGQIHVVWEFIGTHAEYDREY